MKLKLPKLNFFKQRKIIFGLIVILFVALAGYLVYSSYTQVLPQSAIYFLNDAVAPKASQRVLVFSPHPDDESIAAGGYIYDSTKNGANIKIVLVTDGNKHGLKVKRYAEFEKATAILGVSSQNLVFLNHSDGKLKQEDQNQIYAEFKKEIDDFHPDIIVYPSLKDEHPDHATTGKIVQKVITDEHYQGTAYQYLVHQSHFPQPDRYAPNLFLLPPTRMITFDKEWLRYYLSSVTENKKDEAVNQYKTQIRVPILRSLMLSSIRKNELFSISGKNND